MDFREIPMPERVEGVPKPTIKAVRRVRLPDGEHWIDIVGGYSQVERRWHSWWVREVTGTAKIKGEAARDKRETELNAALATFFDHHIVDHNLTYPGTSEPLPKTGFELFWELDTPNVYGLLTKIINPPSFFESPKAEESSETG